MCVLCGFSVFFVVLLLLWAFAVFGVCARGWGLSVCLCGLVWVGVCLSVCLFVGVFWVVVVRV